MQGISVQEIKDGGREVGDIARSKFAKKSLSRRKAHLFKVYVNFAFLFCQKEIKNASRNSLL